MQMEELLEIYFSRLAFRKPNIDYRSSLWADTFRDIALTSLQSHF